MQRSLRLGLILIALLLGAQITQAAHVHADGLPHTECLDCQLHADQKLLPTTALPPLAMAKASTSLAYQHTVAPFIPLTTPHNRGPPAFN